ncbi:hypothetical protein [Haloarcula pellucida]|uniref:Uncharacterized protein n=1 Tax=Haloarcula pellucida TaxID=1427151 RepID=A0A830GLB5_9EURY|nr:hypothetical protein [Halomicroarcula pellucida]MBX0348535.1 hypothetical protein [Halomicroarcula pellucida]GGN92918.1 hypothetical protein GCM10009030_17720 [Halomicroarcula pellucida]
MATETPPTMETYSPETILSTMGSIQKMLVVGAVFAGVGYLLVGAALFLEFTQFHPLIDQFFATQTTHSIAGGGPDRAGASLLNAQLATIHKYPSLLLWLKLGGIAHILVGIFVALAAIVRTLTLVPHRLAYAMDE